MLRLGQFYIDKWPAFFTITDVPAWAVTKIFVETRVTYYSVKMGRKARRLGTLILKGFVVKRNTFVSVENQFLIIEK